MSGLLKEVWESQGLKDAGEEVSRELSFMLSDEDSSDTANPTDDDSSKLHAGLKTNTAK